MAMKAPSTIGAIEVLVLVVVVVAPLKDAVAVVETAPIAADVVIESIERSTVIMSGREEEHAVVAEAALLVTEVVYPDVAALRLPSSSNY
jgi:hypothetical protein